MPLRTCYYCDAAIAPDERYCPQCNQPLGLRERYRLLRVLGQGGFGVVYEARDLLLERHCAIKSIAATSLAEQRQIEEEMYILSQHASQFAFIPDVYDTWSEGGRTYLVMEYIDGATLDELRALPWPPNEVEQFVRELLGQLADIHAAGIVHRDIKPQNIKRTPNGRYVLLDFGIAKRSSVTMTAARALSLDYASPEQAQGKTTDQRSDLYSLAATAHHLLAGIPAPNALIRLATAQALPPYALPSTQQLQTTLHALLALDPGARPSSAHAAFDLLNNPLVADLPPRGRKPKLRARTLYWFVAATALIGLLIVVMRPAPPAATIVIANNIPAPAVTSTPLPPPAASSIALVGARNIPISLAPLATGHIRSPLPDFPVGKPVLGGVEFVMNEEQTFIQSRCDAAIAPSQPATFTISTGGTTGTQAVYMLINSAYSTKEAADKRVGTITIIFQNGTTLVRELVLGQNIREWDSGADPAVTRLNSAETAEVYRGISAFQAPGVVDMLTVAIPAALRDVPLTAITFRDTSDDDVGSPNPCLVVWGITIQAEGQIVPF